MSTAPLVAQVMGRPAGVSAGPAAGGWASAELGVTVRPARAPVVPAAGHFRYHGTDGRWSSYHRAGAPPARPAPCNRARAAGMTVTRPMGLALAAVLIGFVTARADEAFEKQVRPLLVEKCIRCHGPDKQKGNLRLDSKAGWQTGGDSGPAVRPGDPDGSLLIKAIHGRDGLERMPPKGKLTDREIAVLTNWVKAGAIDPRGGGPVKLGGLSADEARKWWAFQPVKRPAVPPGAFASPVDAFIAAKLGERKLTLSPPADRRTLVRRVTYDL